VIKYLVAARIGGALLAPKTTTRKRASMSETTQYLRPAQVCKLLNIGRATLYRWHAKNPNFPRLSRLSDRCTVWDAAAIDAYVKGQAAKVQA